MKNPIPFKIPKSANHALLVQLDSGPHFYDRLHYHEDYQIIAIIRGEGVLYLGNSTSPFNAGDVFMIGSNVPHLLKSDNKYFTKNSPNIQGISLFFNEGSFGQSFFGLKEMKGVKALLKDSLKGIRVIGTSQNPIFNRITSITKQQNEKRIITFLKILSQLNSCKKEYLNSTPCNQISNSELGGRLKKVLDYTFENYKQEITIEKIASLAHLSRAQFSHFFKLHTGKTYIQFLNELRIENACVLLKNDTYSIEHICYGVGFKNMSNFLRHFKKLKNTTPSQFKKLWTHG
ncbi:AraC family transcriptional regulator [Flagellimonas sp. S174]|uniref:AraC family transcriptional regulator n=1 Tax=Flagellimonas sp. S174 TaxID=3410790 RepID=UPI003BF4DF9E